jgi:RNA polymerase-binding transcription factor DksA
VDERDKHKLEGLLQARSEDMGRRRRPRSRRSLDDPAYERPRPAREEPAVPPSVRECGDCGAEIAPRRVRAMPSATRCLGCQRAFERAQSPA